MKQIEVYAERIDAKHVLFLFDSCFSGSIFSLSRGIPENINYKTALPVRQFITSGSADEQVPDTSIFRQQFDAALAGEGDINKDGYVTGAELGEFLQSSVINYSRGAQHPQYGKIRHPKLDKGDFVFVLPDHGETGLQVDSDPPGAGIWVNGVHRGMTPAAIGDLESGYASVRISKAGYKTVAQEVLIEADGMAKLTVQLSRIEKRPISGYLTVETAQPNTRVRILNIKPTYDPGMQLKPGRYHLEISKTGYRSRKQWIDIDAGEHKLISIGNLEPMAISEKDLTVSLTVNGRIQLDDPWNKGSRPVNEWAKPIYRIWFDTNGNPHDGGWDNGKGPRQAELWLDSGRLGFRWDGPDGDANTADDVRHWPLKKTANDSWEDKEIRARISSDTKTLEATVPLGKLGSPETLEVSFMASPWTTSASDNLGPGASNRPAWIVVPDTGKLSTYTQKDKVGDNDWPNLLPKRSSNFDLVEARVEVRHRSVVEKQRIYIASGTNPSGVGERFAGGSACCGCRIEHSGQLPNNFPKRKVRSVSFYLTASRADSYYTRIKNGTTKLQFVFGNSVSTAQSKKLDAVSEIPVRHSWIIVFKFDEPIDASPGIKWKLLDGDENIYSAVLVHASSKATPEDRQNALPGQAKVLNCQYARTDKMWYSVRFEFE